MCVIADRYRPPIAALTLLVVLLGACLRERYEGFKQLAPDLHYRLHALGEDGDPPGDRDSVLLRIRAAVHGDAPGTLFSTERWYGLDRSDRLRRQVIGRMREGDSVSVIMRQAAIPWEWLAKGTSPAAPDTAMIDLELRIMDVMTPEEAMVAAERRRLADPDGHETRLLAAYMDSTWINWGDLVHYRIEAPGTDTAGIRTGDLVTIHYQGRFIGGAVFDDTRRNGQPLTFRLGDPDQVIKGIEMAVHQLRKGAKGTFAMRSAMAFGPSGSSSGLVPPHTPVVYTVEVVDVDRAGGS